MGGATLLGAFATSAITPFPTGHCVPN
jgi:hypothetical protein